MTPEQKNEYYRKRRAADPERAREYDRKYRAAHKGKANAATAAWRVANPLHRIDYYWSDDNVRIRDNLRHRIYSALTHRKSRRDWDEAVRGIASCSKPELVAHIEAQFLPGMTWDNYGRKGWEIDHIKPCVTFNLTDHTQVLACFHYTNLRPLWRSDNQRRPRKEQL